MQLMQRARRASCRVQRWRPIFRAKLANIVNYNITNGNCKAKFTLLMPGMRIISDIFHFLQPDMVCGIVNPFS